MAEGRWNSIQSVVITREELKIMETGKLENNKRDSVRARLAVNFEDFQVLVKG